jgi:predicted lipoprotein with Yx(FWY)xxD motif
MGVVRMDELTALADGVLPPSRRAKVEAEVAASPELASLLRVQLETAQTIRTAAAQVEAPEYLRRLIERRRREVHMKRLLTSVSALGATLVLAACGGGGAGGSPDSATTAHGTTTVAVRQVDGIGRVLVDGGGRALYSADVETGGKVRCTGACTSFWKPLRLDSGTPSAVAGAGTLDVVRRPDGTDQVTANGKALYTFSEDAPGKVAGNGFSDDFNGRRFTWTAVRAGGKAAGTSGGAGKASPGNDYGY